MSPLNTFHPPQRAECWPLMSETKHWSILTSSPATHSLHISCLVSIYPFHKHSSSSFSKRGCSGEQTAPSVCNPLGGFSLALVTRHNTCYLKHVPAQLLQLCLTLVATPWTVACQAQSGRGRPSSLVRLVGWCPGKGSLPAPPLVFYPHQLFLLDHSHAPPPSRTSLPDHPAPWLQKVKV